MGYGAASIMMLTTLLKLGRVSNVPTVWSNTLAGAILAGATGFNASSILLLLAMTLAYVGGMFLNDAFDRKIDSIERPERPIPSGIISARTVFILGFTMLFCSVGLVALTAHQANGVVNYAMASTVALSVCIVLYNVWHKNNPMSPFIMGLCRMLVYLSAAFALVPNPGMAVYVGALTTLCYLIGLTYIAKHENKSDGFAAWPIVFFIAPIGFGIFHSFNSLSTLLFTLLFTGWLVYSLQFIVNSAKRNIPKAVVSMIAGISLLDAIYISSAGATSLAFFALISFLLTLYLQRYIMGT